MRKVGFLVIAGWMLLSPAHVQVFGGRPAMARAWRMFGKQGLGICSAVYYDGERRIDRYSLFGVGRADAPQSFRRITNEEEARSFGKQICEKLQSTRDGRPVQVRLTLRCGEKVDGLRTVLDREENLCEG